MARLHAFLVCYTVVNFCICLSSCGTNSASDVVKALTNVVEYCKKNYQTLNFDAHFGLRVIEGQMKLMLNEYENGSHRSAPAPVMTQIRHLAGEAAKVANMAVPHLLESNRNTFSVLKHQVEKPWLHFRPHRLIDSNLQWDLDKVKKPREVTENDRNSCMFELTDTNKERQKCSASLNCLQMMTTRGQHGFSLQHQIFYSGFAEQIGCKTAIENYLAAQARKIQLHQLQHEFCTNAYYELMGTSAFYGIQPSFKHLFLLMEFNCPNLGFFQLLNQDWLTLILSWQTPTGCIVMRSQQNDIYDSKDSLIDAESNNRINTRTNDNTDGEVGKAAVKQEQHDFRHHGEPEEHQQELSGRQENNDNHRANVAYPFQNQQFVKPYPVHSDVLQNSNHFDPPKADKNMIDPMNINGQEARYSNRKKVLPTAWFPNSNYRVQSNVDQEPMRFHQQAEHAISDTKDHNEQDVHLLHQSAGAQVISHNVGPAEDLEVNDLKAEPGGAAMDHVHEMFHGAQIFPQQHPQMMKIPQGVESHETNYNNAFHKRAEPILEPSHAELNPNNFPFVPQRDRFQGQHLSRDDENDAQEHGRYKRQTSHQNRGLLQMTAKTDARDEDDGYFFDREKHLGSNGNSSEKHVYLYYYPVYEQMKRMREQKEKMKLKREERNKKLASTSRKLLKEQVPIGTCNMQMTGLAACALAMYVRFLIDPGPPEFHSLRLNKPTGTYDVGMKDSLEDDEPEEPPYVPVNRHNSDRENAALKNLKNMRDNGAFSAAADIRPLYVGDIRKRFHPEESDDYVRRAETRKELVDRAFERKRQQIEQTAVVPLPQLQEIVAPEADISQIKLEDVPKLNTISSASGNRSVPTEVSFLLMSAKISALHKHLKSDLGYQLIAVFIISLLCLYILFRYFRFKSRVRHRTKYV